VSPAPRPLLRKGSAAQLDHPLGSVVPARVGVPPVLEVEVEVEVGHGWPSGWRACVPSAAVHQRPATAPPALSG